MTIIALSSKRVALFCQTRVYKFSLTLIIIQPRLTQSCLSKGRRATIKIKGKKLAKLRHKSTGWLKFWVSREKWLEIMLNGNRHELRTKELKMKTTSSLRRLKKVSFRNNYRLINKLNDRYKAHIVVWENFNLEYFRFIRIRRLNFSLFLNVC